MKREDFEKKTFEEVMEQLDDEKDNITTLDVLKEFMIYHIKKDNMYLVEHIADAICNDKNSDAEWWDYDYTLGTLDLPCSITCKNDVKYLIED